MYNNLSFLVLELAREREREIELHRLAAQAHRPDDAGSLRRSLAAGLAAVSRGSAAVARRLDAEVLATGPEHPRS